MNDIAISVGESCSKDERDVVVRSLVGYNESRAPSARHTELCAFARHGNDVVGGLLGHTHWSWLFVKQLWVAESFRGRGLGKELMRAAEQEAIRRGCFHVHCDTFDFQALPFYKRIGFSVFGQLDDYPPGHTRYFLQKRNLHDS